MLSWRPRSAASLSETLDELIRKHHDNRESLYHDLCGLSDEAEAGRQ
jgi:hypothetical protein